MTANIVRITSNQRCDGLEAAAAHRQMLTNLFAYSAGYTLTHTYTHMYTHMYTHTHTKVHACGHPQWPGHISLPATLLARLLLFA